MKKTTLALMLLAVLALVGCSPAQQEEVADLLTEEEPTQEQSDETIEAMTEEDTEQEQEEASEETTEESDEAETSYSAAVYTDNQAALQEAGPKVVYFHADWCPTCRALEERVQSTLGQFPDGTKIVKVDYDAETALKNQYGVKVQTSLVVLNAEGEQVGNVLVNPSNEQLIEAINQTL
jgi:thiol-disulfide isomerase/thioredoxin